MIRQFNKIESVKGTLILPGDKSISHRAVMLSSIADGESKIYNCLLSEDVLATINAFRELGIKIDIEDNNITVWGNGFSGLTEPANNLFMGNSGTTTRLIAGILAAQNFQTVLTGDKSLSSRPIKRIITPLRQMHANISGENNCLPLTIKPSESLRSIQYKLPLASAQVKSCILLAGLYLDEETVVVENFITRDHTERMLGLKVVEDGDSKKIYSSINYFPSATEYFIPSDISTSAFFMVLALLTKNSEITLKNISLNETRTGVIDILVAMGANIESENVETINGEQRGDLIIKSSDLINVEIPEELVPNIIDEIPILTIAGIFGEGHFEIKNAKELRTKESDRINSICRNLEKLGLDIEEYDDGYLISGEIKNKNVSFNSFGDHRIAMSFAILSSIVGCGCSIENFDCVNVSNPNFIDQLNSIVV